MPTIIEEDVQALLVANPALVAYPDSIPNDGVYPCVVWQRISTNQQRTHSGNSLEKIRFQLTAWGKTKTSSLTTAQSVKTKFDLNKTNFVLATKENEIQTKEVETGLYSTLLDFFVWSNK